MKSASFDSFSDPEPEAVTLTFGKHRGKPLTDIESSYLEWVLTADRITPDLKAAITTALAARAPAIRDRWKAPSPTSQDVVDLAGLIIETGHKELAEAFGLDNDYTQAITLLKTLLYTVNTDDGDLVF